MKIDYISVNNNLNNNSNIKNINNQKFKNDNIEQQDYQVSLNFDKIKNSIKESNGIDYEKVNFFKDKILKKEYEIDFKKLSNNILQEEL